jgi:hypothetical protein
MSPKKKDAPDTQIGIRLSTVVVARADKIIPALATVRGTSQTRVDVLREAIMVGLNVLEGKIGLGPERVK